MSNEYLIYIPNKQKFADVEGYTHIADKISDEGELSEFKLLTDNEGNILNNEVKILISQNRILSNRPKKNISPSEFYHAPSKIVAESFVFKENRNKPLISTSRNGLGSGIYGTYNKPESAVYLLKSDKFYNIQDKEHGESLTVASLNTNVVLDKIIEAEDITVDDKDLNRLYLLWNIVFTRTDDYISKESLKVILERYIQDFFSLDSLIDTITHEPIIRLPINYIMLFLNYDGIIANDYYNNGWNRGCIDYRYNQADIIRGDNAKY